MSELFTLRDVLTEQLRDLYDAETQYHTMLPGLIETSQSEDLGFVLMAIMRQTAENTTRLAWACEKLQAEPTGIVCKAMEGLIRESRDTTKNRGEPAAIDAALIANAQRIAHYEIAGFGTAKAFACQINEPAVAEALDDLLAEAWLADRALTRIATGGSSGPGVNEKASNGEDK